LATHPPLFSGGRDPLEADDWLRTIESKFSLLNYTEYQKTLYAAQQLRGPAGAWWASYTAALPADHHVPWGEFRTAFRGHHLSAGTMRRKLAEFLDLHQGNRSVYEYFQEFNNLAQYGSHHVDTDAKKAELFRKGLTIQLQDHLVLSQNLSYNELASAAIDQEGTMKACEAAEEKKRKRAVS
ncbi:retrotransposon gag family protein, partial [Vibrio sp.]|uniref:retrotransposon gag family protein n=1 Tax=Vibrio sp. TaxID=678 RepID=UPI003D0D74A4